MELLNTEEVRKYLVNIKSVYGYDFTEYAEASIKRRIQHYMSINKIRTFSDLQERTLRDEKIFDDFVQNVSVTVTEMFRDPLFYKSLREHVKKRLATYPFLKIWVAGCATGEEVYSIAILLKEEGLLGRSVIYATDINQSSILTAKNGIYPLDNIKNYTLNYQKAGGLEEFSQYYIAGADSVMFDKSLKKNIVFSYHNLATDKSFNEFQLILCRNVLIYFNQQLQNKVINLFYDSLPVFGILGLGNKESLLFTDRKDYFDKTDQKEKIFMKMK